MRAGGVSDGEEDGREALRGWTLGRILGVDPKRGGPWGGPWKGGLWEGWTRGGVASWGKTLGGEDPGRGDHGGGVGPEENPGEGSVGWDGENLPGRS